jgi:hypothetical protein
MRCYVKTWPNRVWAVEGANGAGRPHHRQSRGQEKLDKDREDILAASRT